MHARTPVPSRSPRSVAAAVLLAVAAGAASAQNYGRDTATHEVVQTTINPAGDTDVFVFQGAPGFKLKAKAKRAKGATVLPVVDLLAPDGAQVVDGVIAKSGRATGSLSATLADGGLFGLRRLADGQGGGDEQFQELGQQ